MASQLKIDDLRAELSKRGLSTAGIKPTLVKRLESIISKENSSQLPDSNYDSSSRKRQSDCTDGDSVDGEKIRAVDKLRSLNVKQLREEATLRGVSTSGSKKELLDRLCEDSKADSSDIIEAKEEEDTKETKKEKLVTATKKGSAVLDQWLPDHIKSGYHVLQTNDEIYDAMLNQTNIGDNNNNFFVLQVLESDDGGRYMVYNRWGRVGVKGQDKLYGPHTLAESAIQEFEQKFYAKTKNLWSERAEFVFHPKCYAWLEMDYDKTEKETACLEMDSMTDQERLVYTNLLRDLSNESLGIVKEDHKQHFWEQLADVYNQRMSQLGIQFTRRNFLDMLAMGQDTQYRYNAQRAALKSGNLREPTCPILEQIFSRCEACDRKIPIFSTTVQNGRVSSYVSRSQANNGRYLRGGSSGGRSERRSGGRITRSRSRFSRDSESEGGSSFHIGQSSGMAQSPEVPPEIADIIASLLGLPDIDPDVILRAIAASPRWTEGLRSVVFAALRRTDITLPAKAVILQSQSLL